MNLSTHLPQPLFVTRDDFAQNHSIRRSEAVLSGVEICVVQKTVSQCPADVLP